MVKKSQKQQKKRVETQEYAILGILSLAIASIFVFSVFGFNFSGSGLATFNLVVDAATGCTVDQNGALSAIGGTENVTVTDVNGATKDGTPILLNNTGNVDLDVQFQSNKAASGLLSGTSPAFLWNFSNNETSSATIHSSFATWVAVSTGAITPVTSFQFEPATDTIRVDFNVTVPADEPVATKTATITITCSAS
jgi:hypothetical protein